jgi:phosphoenolpyruvate-protein kinase (PTS system EI component)
MERKYPVLHVISIFLKVISIIIIIARIVGGLALVAGASTSHSLILTFGSGIVGVVGMVVAFIIGMLLYARAELLDCFVDIEFNTIGTYYNTKPKKIASLKNNVK